MKRSTQIGLLVMGALGTTTAAGYFAFNHEQTCQTGAPNNPQATPAQNCRRSVWSGHGSGSSRPIFGNPSSSGGSGAPSTPSSPGTSTPRGGFGGFGSGIGRFFAGG